MNNAKENAGLLGTFHRTPGQIPVSRDLNG